MSEQTISEMPASTNPIAIAIPLGYTPCDETRKIISEVAYKHGLTYDQMFSRGQKHCFAHARQEAFARLYAATPQYSHHRSLPWLGRLFKRHHTTILYGIRAHNERVKAAQEMAKATAAHA